MGFKKVWPPTACLSLHTSLICEFRFWHQVTLALRANDTERATDEKLKIDARMKQAEEDRREKDIEYEPKYFEQAEDGSWVYKYFEYESLSLSPLLPFHQKC